MAFVSALGNWVESAGTLLKNQINDWVMCRIGYESLKIVKIKEFDFDGFKIKVQCNPGRMTSTSAKVDSTSIKERKCFLCVDNLPSEQNGIRYGTDYQILVNPFPIFNEHFTLPSIKHQPQQIESTLDTLLDFSKDLGERYIVFYNGPKCGASAPDHLHFQAGERNFIPLFDEYHLLSEMYGKEVFSDDSFSLTAIDDGLRKYVSIKSTDKEKILVLFNKFIKTYKDFMNSEDEPMFNILSSYDVELKEWLVLIFLRKKHRPSHYFDTPEKQILLSPAAVDISGVCITPREDDFNKIDKDILTEIFREVFISSDELSGFINNLKSI